MSDKSTVTLTRDQIIEALQNFSPAEVGGLIEEAFGQGTKAGETMFELYLADGSIRMDALVDIPATHPRANDVIHMGMYLDDTVGLLNWQAKQNGLEELVRFRKHDRKGNRIE